MGNVYRGCYVRCLSSFNVNIGHLFLLYSKYNKKSYISYEVKNLPFVNNMIKFLLGRERLQKLVGTKLTFPVPIINKEVYDYLKYELNYFSIPHPIIKKYWSKKSLHKYVEDNPSMMTSSVAGEKYKRLPRECKISIEKVNNALKDAKEDNLLELNKTYSCVHVTDTDIFVTMVDNGQLISVNEAVEFWREYNNI